MIKIYLLHACRAIMVLSFAVGMVFDSYAQKTPDDKLTAEEILAKHLESIGTDEARNSVRAIIAVGSAKATFFGRGAAEGTSVLASKGEKYLVAMKFDTADYPFEKMGFDGNDFSVGFVRPGVRSTLGVFLRTNQNAFKTGIVSGSLATSWALLKYDPKIAKIKYTGTKKIDGRKLLVVDYIPKRRSDLDITLFFDPETFQHVRTQYTRVIAAGQGTSVDSSAAQTEVRYTMIEDFSDFRKEDRLTLPHVYRITFETHTGNSSASYEWLMKLQRFIFNSDIDDKEFNVDTHK